MADRKLHDLELSGNCYKVRLFSALLGLDVEIVPVDFMGGAHKTPAFLEKNPFGEIPVLEDGDFILRDSQAILVYLADKTGKFLPKETRARNEAMQWLMWQMGGFGPMLGQNHHFNRYAPEQIDYAINRYVNETARLYGVLDRQLEGRDYVTGEYSIADMATYPWAVPYEAQKQDLNDFPNVKRWFETMAARPAVIRVYESKDALYPQGEEMTEEEKAKLFGIKK